MQDLGKLMIGQNIQEVLERDLKLKLHAHPAPKKAIAYCETCGDHVSCELFENILEGEENHIDWLETQLEMIGKVGPQNYQQSQM